ncbi:MAG: Crp/Fnr family transcriptional regulator [Bacteroidota bacterium]
MQIIKHIIERVQPLSDSEWQRIQAAIRTQHFAKGEVLQQEGQIAQDVYFIVQGLLRIYYVKGGNEFTRQFFFENGFVTDLASCISGQPTRLFIDAVEPTEVLRIPYSELEKLKAAKEQVLSTAYVKVVDRMASIFLDSPEEKYRQLVAQRPKVMQRIPQYMIASYVGVTPEGLSRIKKRMADADRS